jgi:hypothetical protein
MAAYRTAVLTFLPNMKMTKIRFVTLCAFILGLAFLVGCAGSNVRHPVGAPSRPYVDADGIVRENASAAEIAVDSIRKVNKAVPSPWQGLLEPLLIGAAGISSAYAVDHSRRTRKAIREKS